MLIDAATRVLLRDGYPTLTLRSLADELGVSHTALYTYAKSVRELEDKAVHQLVDRLPRPGASSASGVRAELQDFLAAAKPLLLQHPGMYLSPADSPASKAFAAYGDLWRRALLPYAPDVKTVELAMGSLLSTVFLSVECERRLGVEPDRKNTRSPAQPSPDSTAHYSLEQYLDALIDLVLPRLRSGADGGKADKRRSKNK